MPNCTGGASTFEHILRRRANCIARCITYDTHNVIKKKKSTHCAPHPHPTPARTFPPPQILVPLGTTQNGFHTVTGSQRIHLHQIIITLFSLLLITRPLSPVLVTPDRFFGGGTTNETTPDRGFWGGWSEVQQMRPPHNGVFGGVQKWPVRSGWDRSGPGGLTCANIPLRTLYLFIINK